MKSPGHISTGSASALRCVATESVIEQTKDNYYASLRKTRDTIRTATPDWQAWIVY